VPAAYPVDVTSTHWAKSPKVSPIQSRALRADIEKSAPSDGHARSWSVAAVQNDWWSLSLPSKITDAQQLRHKMTHSALETLHFFSREFSDLWARYERSRSICRELADWPTWCYAPIAAALPISGDNKPMLAAKLTALGTWRMTKGIYRFDSTLMEELLRTPLDAAVPVDVLYRLPEWCVYVELDAMPTFAGTARGVWAWLEPARTRSVESVVLSILFDTAGSTADMLDERSTIALHIELSGDSVLEALESTYPQATPVLDAFAELARPVISLLLYLCSSRSEISLDGVLTRPSLPVPVRTRRHGEKLFPAAAPRVWDLGIRIGSELRAARAASGNSTGSTGRSVVPHIRRPHWHTFVIGPRKGIELQARARDVRWMPPIAVAVTDVDAMPATIHPVSRPDARTSSHR
jgi:hypothetical protein